MLDGFAGGIAQNLWELVTHPLFLSIVGVLGVTTYLFGTRSRRGRGRRR